MGKKEPKFKIGTILRLDDSVSRRNPLFDIVINKVNKLNYWVQYLNEPRDKLIYKHEVLENKDYVVVSKIEQMFFKLREKTNVSKS